MIWKEKKVYFKFGASEFNLIQLDPDNISWDSWRLRKFISTREADVGVLCCQSEPFAEQSTYLNPYLRKEKRKEKKKDSYQKLYMLLVINYFTQSNWRLFEMKTSFGHSLIISTSHVSSKYWSSIYSYFLNPSSSRSWPRFPCR